MAKGKTVRSGNKINKRAGSGKSTGKTQPNGKKASIRPPFDKEAFKTRLEWEIANARNELRLELHVQYKMLVEKGIGVGSFDDWVKEYTDQYIHTQSLLNSNPIKIDKDFAPVLKKVSKEYKDN